MDTYKIDGVIVDSIELKALAVSRGIKVNTRIYKELGKARRIYADPLKCICMILPDGTIVQMTDLQFHLNYLKNALSWDSLKQMKYFSQMNTPFSLNIDENGQPTLYHRNDPVTQVRFSEPTGFLIKRHPRDCPFSVMQ